MESGDYDSEILLPNIPPEHKYQVFLKDRKETVNKHGGGVIIMLKPGLPAEECLDLDTYCEIKWVKVNTSHDHQILVGPYYREPKSTWMLLTS